MRERTGSYGLPYPTHYLYAYYKSFMRNGIWVTHPFDPSAPPPRKKRKRYWTTESGSYRCVGDKPWYCHDDSHAPILARLRARALERQRARTERLRGLGIAQNLVRTFIAKLSRPRWNRSGWNLRCDESICDDSHSNLSSPASID